MAPFLLRPWVRFQEVLPEVMLFGLNISVTVVSFVFFIIVRIIGNAILSYNNWPPGEFNTMFTNSCIVAMSHSSNLILPLAQGLWMLPYKPTMSQSAAPKYWQLASDAMLQFCTAYMLQDSLLTVIRAYQLGGLQDGDLLFIAHHFATFSYMTQCRWIDAGYISAMTCILCGEVSNPPMMVWYITDKAIKSACCSGPRVQFLFEIFSVIYAFVYFVARAILAPMMALAFVYDFFFTGQKSVSLGLCIYWFLAVLGVIAGSYGYILETWEILMKAIE